MGLGLLSLVLMFADSRFDYLSQLRYYVAMMITPIHYVAVMPARLTQYLTGSVQAHADLIAENEALREQLLLQSYKLQKLEHLTAENRRLNELLNASSDVAEKVVRAQLTGESPDPFSKRVLINKGSADGVYIGQMVIDAEGLMGQVVELGRNNSWVLLITDPLHHTPVQVDRNGVRAIASGTRDSLHMLTLSNIPNTTDIQVGDELVTSGLGQRFTPGYPVGVVSRIELDPGKPFAEVLVTPAAHIDRSRNLLLVFENREESASVEAVGEVLDEGSAQSGTTAEAEPAQAESALPAAPDAGAVSAQTEVPVSAPTQTELAQTAIVVGESTSAEQTETTATAVGQGEEAGSGAADADVNTGTTQQ